MQPLKSGVPFRVFGISADLIELSSRIIYHIRGDNQMTDICRGERMFILHQTAFYGTYQASGPGFFLKGIFCNLMERLILKEEVDTICFEITFFPDDDRALGIL